MKDEEDGFCRAAVVNVEEVGQGLADPIPIPTCASARRVPHARAFAEPVASTPPCATNCARRLTG
jgi:hypothetical protein